MDTKLVILDEGVDPEMVELSCCLTNMIFF